MQRPSPVSKDDPIDGFDSGSPVLDRWFAAHALQNQESGASRTYVVREAGRIVAFYSLATGGVEHSRAPGGIRRNYARPDPGHDPCPSCRGPYPPGTGARPGAGKGCASQDPQSLRDRRNTRCDCPRPRCAGSRLLQAPGLQAVPGG